MILARLSCAAVYAVLGIQTELDATCMSRAGVHICHWV